MTGRKSRVLLASVGAALIGLAVYGCGRTTNSSGQGGNPATAECVQVDDCAGMGGGTPVIPMGGADSQPDSSAGMGGDSLAGAGAGPSCSKVSLAWPTAPVDFIVTVDNSGSMVDEVPAIELALNGRFASALADSKLDYRVILVSRHRKDVVSASSESSTSLCITAPLSGLASCPGQMPAFSDRFFQYSIKVESRNALATLLASYGTADVRYALAPLGWSAWLRPGSHAVFTVLTDDNDSMLPGDFANALSSLSAEHFGAPDSPAFTFHSIVGLAQKTDPGSAYLPGEPVQTQTCVGGLSTTSDAGLAYQQLSLETAGLRFPICETDRIDGMFAAIVLDAVAKSAPLCELELPAPTPDLTGLDVTYTTVADTKTTFTRVATSSDCAMHAFYVEGARVRLCPDTCAQVRSQPGTVQLHTCAP